MKSGLLSREGRIIEKKSYPMTDTFEELLACMKDFHQMFKDDYELDDVAISSCGSIDVENAVIDAVWALPFLQGIPWREVIQKELGLHCEIENDANCAALSEVYFGEAQDIKDMAFFVIGTGVGGAISQRDDFVERLMEEYNIICEKIGMDIITPNLKCCTYRQGANLLVALANYIGRNE